MKQTLICTVHSKYIYIYHCHMYIKCIPCFESEHVDATSDRKMECTEGRRQRFISTVRGIHVHV
jgi:hypothetical protein